MSRNDSSEGFLLDVLRHTFPEELAGLTQDSCYQKPDYIDVAAGIGVEATIAGYGNETMIKGEKKFDELEGAVLTADVEDELRKLGRTALGYGGKLVDSAAVFWSDDSYPAIGAAIKAKLAKLNNGNYDAVQDIRLVIKDILDVTNSKKLLKAIEDAQSEFVANGGGVRSFSHIYVVPDRQRVVYHYRADTGEIEIREFKC